MNLTKLTTTTIIALSLTLPAGAAFGQEREETVDQNLNQAEQDIDNVGENLKDAGKAFGNSIENTGEAAEQGLENTGEAIDEGLNDAGNVIERNYNQAEEQVQQTAAEAEENINRAAEAAQAEIAETAAAIEQRSNWGWLGLLGLLGLFGLAGRNKKTTVVEERRDLESLNPSDRTTMYNS